MVESKIRNDKGQWVKGRILPTEWVRDTSGPNNNFYGKKHTEETKKLIREKRKLQKPTFLGRRHSDATKNKISLTKKQSEATPRGENNAAWTGGLPKCLDCNKKLANRNAVFCHVCAFIGERAANWKGGITPLVRRIRGCFLYRQWRSDIYTRDNFTCQMCGKRGGNLEVDHYPKMFSEIFKENKIKSYEQGIGCEEFWNINNGRTLCRTCHDSTKHNRGSKLLDK